MRWLLDNRIEVEGKLTPFGEFLPQNRIARQFDLVSSLILTNFPPEKNGRDASGTM